jgi:hypothetical protein
MLFRASTSRGTHAAMRMPWSKSKGEQLDLLDATAVASTDSIACRAVPTR